MPIKIFDSKGDKEIAWLAGDVWDLPNQLLALEKWLEENRDSYPAGEYVADIGFDIRPNAFGGGGTLSSKSMLLLGKLGMEIYFSEYPDTLTSEEDES